MIDGFPGVIALAYHLTRSSLSVAVAESCTGGLLGAVLTAPPGASAYMAGGVIAYSDAVKQSLLGVSADLLSRHGAVSEAVVIAMADGVRRVCGADIGVAVTGIAGPGGDRGAKPVGLIYLAVAMDGFVPVVRELGGDGGRDANRARAVTQAIDLCALVVGVAR